MARHVHSAYTASVTIGMAICALGWWQAAGAGSPSTWNRASLQGTTQVPDSPVDFGTRPTPAPSSTASGYDSRDSQEEGSVSSPESTPPTTSKLGRGRRVLRISGHATISSCCGGGGPEPDPLIEQKLHDLIGRIREQAVAGKTEAWSLRSDFNDEFEALRRSTPGEFRRILSEIYRAERNEILAEVIAEELRLGWWSEEDEAAFEPTLLGLVDDPEPFRRQKAVAIMDDFDRPAIGERWLRCVRADPDAGVRLAAVENVRYDIPGATQAIQEAAQFDPDPQVRCGALKQLARNATDDEMSILVSTLLHDPSPAIQVGCATALRSEASTRDRIAWDALLRVARDARRDATVRRSALEAIVYGNWRGSREERAALHQELDAIEENNP